MPGSAWSSSPSSCKEREFSRGLSIALSSETAAHAVMTTLAPGENLTTIEVKNSFLSMASEGCLIAEAMVFKRGRVLVIVDCMVRDDRGKDISRSSATLMVIREQTRSKSIPEGVDCEVGNVTKPHQT